MTERARYLWVIAIIALTYAALTAGYFWYSESVALPWGIYAVSVALCARLLLHGEGRS